ncbi:MAG TPA: IclR family transcriptional regulator [Myxococcota bacterium]|nr:IclR family transcriptional regulator [Myxococcota bacterium]
MTADARATSELGSAIDKALELLFHLHEVGGGPHGVSELGRALALPKSTVHRLLAALLRRGLVEQDARGRYRPGIALLALGLGVQEREPLVAAARPEVESLAEELGETIFLSGMRAGKLYVLDKQEGTGFLRAAPRVGAEIPAHATAIGKLYLAFAPESLGPPPAPLPRYSSATLSEPRALAREIEQVRARGFALMREEWIPGLAGVAVPVRAGERLAGALAAAGPTAHFDGRDQQFRDALLRAAREIEKRLGGGARRAGAAQGDSR